MYCGCRCPFGRDRRRNFPFPQKQKPADETVDSSSVSQESSSAPDFAIKVTPSSDSSSAVQSDVKSRSEAVSEEISPEAFKKTVDAAACFYYMSFDSSSLSVRDCFDILESLTVEQSITGQNDFFPAERKDFSNLVTKDTAAAVFPSFWEKIRRVRLLPSFFRRTKL